MVVILASKVVRDACADLGTPYLSNHLGMLLCACMFFFFMQATSSCLSPLFFPTHFKRYSSKTRLDWDLHFTGWVHALISTPLSLYMIFNPSPALIDDPVFAYAPMEGTIFAFSGGYFLYDLMVSIYYVRSHGFPFLLHATACCFIFFKAFTPMLMGVGSMFLIWEISTIFLHPQWWTDKLEMTGSRLQIINGVCLLLSFFGARILYGLFMTVRLWLLLDDPRISPAMRWGFRFANIALNGLNWNWFRMMLRSLQKRLEIARSTQKNGASSSDSVTTAKDLLHLKEE